jgi:hypothetical protein
MSKQADHLSSYEIGIRRLLNGMGQSHPRYSEALVYQQRLEENIAKSRQYGETPTLDAERFAIVHQLNDLALSALGKSFSELCDQITLATQVKAKVRLNIDDPLSLIQPDTEGPASLFLEDIIEARSRSDWEEMLRLCDDAQKFISKYRESRDQVGIATIHLYQADAQTRTGSLEKGIATARRAKGTFERCDHPYLTVAHLLLARLKARQNLGDAQQEYEDTLKHCQDRESRVEEGVQSKEAWFYEQIIEQAGVVEIIGQVENKEAWFYKQITEEIKRVKRDLSQVLVEEFKQSCRLNSIPILRLSDGPDMIFEPSGMIEYIATGEFEIKRHSEMCPYLLRSLDETRKTLELKSGAVHFALPVPEDGWPTPTSKEEEDFLLVRQEAQITREGPGVLWTSEKWATGRFERDDTGIIYFTASKPYIIGEETIEIEKEVTEEKAQGCVIGLLKPRGHAAMDLLGL